ncbi:hypothetical protein KQ940_16575 [Marinobacterium sp. D7]|uniref:hypothetical protein n=1 Tax=Marinobacterium ramblicola TaxID=2849041 RepID=UPI001C2CC709|nr:hypothetical protein [Marinobacterium ramblicola]MBV1789671.1 hypothetical protein [Marinobacterium ramblicola]
MKTQTLLASVLGMMLAGTASAAPVDSINFNYSANKAMQTKYKVKLVNGKLTLMTPSAAMGLGGASVFCSKRHHFTGAELYLGPVTASGASLNKSQARLSDWTVNVASYVKGDIVEANSEPPLVFDIQVNSIAANYFNPVKTVEAELQKAKQGGMSDATFLSKTRLFKVERPVTLAAKCTHNNNGDTAYAVKQVQADFMVEYEGTPQAMVGGTQIAKPVKVIAVPLGGSGQIESQYGITISAGQLISLQGDYSGQCPKDVNFQGQLVAQGKGKMQIHIKRNGQPIYTSQRFDYNGGNVLHNFMVKAELNGQPLNTTQNYSFNMYVKTQAKPNDAWTDWDFVDSYQWKQTCKPMVGIKATSGNGGILQQQAPAPARAKN